MISDLDETLKQLLTKKMPLDPGEVNITFDAPDRKWAGSQSKPTVNFYLYDLRENHELRSNAWTVERNQNGIATKKKAPLRVDLSYLVTVWTKHVEDEHRLMGQLLVVLSRHPILADDVLQGMLKGLDYPIRATAAQPDGLFKNPADLWSALDNQLKPSINYVVTLPMDLDIAFTAPIVSTKIIEVKELEKGEVEEIVQVGGVVHETGNPDAGIARATVIVKEARMTTKTDDSGRYVFPKLQRGSYTFQVVAAGRPTREVQVVIPNDSYEIEL